MFEYVLASARGRRVLVDRTASPQHGDPIDLPGELTDLSFYPWPPENLRELALGSDVILVCGGNTASAGMICWFEAGVTDSFGPQLEGMRDGLGFLPGSACPHYDTEERRRPVYNALVGNGFPAGIALDDGAAAHYAGTELQEIVVSKPNERGYHVGPDGEVPLPVRVLTAPG